MKLTFTIESTNIKYNVNDLSVDRLRYLQDKNTKKNNNLVCSISGNWVQIRAIESDKGMPRHVYFPGGRPSWLKPESSEHFFAKLSLVDMIKKRFPSAEFDVEHEIKHSQMIRDHREIDVACFMYGKKIAYEIQLSPISVKEINERESDHSLCGFATFWAFGKRVSDECRRYKTPFMNVDINDAGDASFVDSNVFGDLIMSRECLRDFVTGGTVYFLEGARYRFQEVTMDNDDKSYYFLKSNTGGTKHVPPAQYAKYFKQDVLYREFSNDRRVR